MAVLTLSTLVFFTLSCALSPGYLAKRADGEFLLLLTKFDAESLCPFCEVVQQPQSKHCYACKSCVVRFHHHCNWINNCVGSKNLWAYILFVVSFGGYLLATIAALSLDLLNRQQSEHMAAGSE